MQQPIPTAQQARHGGHRELLPEMDLSLLARGHLLRLRGIDFGQRRHTPAAEAVAAVMGGQRLAVRRKGEKGARDLARIAHLDAAHFAERRQVPKLDGAIIALGGEGPSVRREDAIQKPSPVAGENGQFLSRRGVPKPARCCPNSR